MRRLLTILGALCLALLLAAGAGAVLLNRHGERLNAEARAFVDDAIPAILQSASGEALLSRASPELKASASPARLRALQLTLSALGPLVAYDGAEGRTDMKLDLRTGRTVSAQFRATGRFERGEATIRVALVRSADDWLIQSFVVEGPAQLDRSV